MAAFGENLRREREMRGVTLEEISTATKISMRFLHAVENEEFGKLPGGIFSRSFIRTYARYLGLDEERVLAEYQLAAQPKADVDLHRMMGSKPPSHASGSRAPLLALLVATAMLSGGYALFRYSRRAIDAQPNPPSQRVSIPMPPPASPTPAGGMPAAAPAVPAGPPGIGTTTTSAPSGPPSPDQSKAATGQPAASPGNRVVANDTGLVLQVAATERSWVAIDADGKTTLQRVLNPNEVETIKAHDSFDVTTGNAQGIVLTLNGETLKPLGRRGEVKSVHLTRDDLKSTTP